MQLFRWPFALALAVSVVSRPADVEAEQLAWTATPSFTGGLFSTHADALNDLHAVGGEYALMTELAADYQSSDTLTFEYKIPDTDPDVSAWLYDSGASGDTDLATEQAAFDALLQYLVDLKSTSDYACPPYVELFPATEPPDAGTWKNYQDYNAVVLGISRSETKLFSALNYHVDSDNGGQCTAYPASSPPGAGVYGLARTREVTCPPYTSRDEQAGTCTSGNRGRIRADSKYYLQAPMPMICDKVGNPCSPASGNKSQREIDLDDREYHSLGFIRYYNSRGDHNSSPALVPGWRHSYDRRLNEATLGRPAHEPGSDRQSGLYLSPYEACLQGWDDIRDTVWSGSLADATATFAGDQNCRISRNGQTLAMFSIRPTLTRFIQPPQPSPTGSNVITLTRPDGRVLHFEYHDGASWQEPFNPELSLQYDGAGWLFTDADKTLERYDSAGKLLSVTDPRGNTKTLGYDADGRLETVHSNTGASLLFGYDSADRIRSVTDAAGRNWTYHYDADNNLETVDNPDGTTRRYHYEDPEHSFALTGITDERGVRYAAWEYDAAGRAILTEHADGAGRVTLAYNADGTTTVTNSRGAVRSYHFEPQHGGLKVNRITGLACPGCPNGEKRLRTYTAEGFLASYTDWSDTVTRFGNHDANGRYGCKVEGVTVADTATGECAFDPAASPQARRFDYTYDSHFPDRVTTITEASVYPGLNRVTTYAYDDYGNKVSETVDGFTPTGAPVSRTTTWEYNGPLHQLSFMDGPRTDVNDYTWYRYHPNDTSVPAGARARLREVEDANGVLLRSNIQYTATGKVRSETRPNGLTLTYTYYPGNDRLETLTEASVTDTRVTRWTWLATGEVESVTAAHGTADATTLLFAYDDARRLTRITDGLGNYIEYTLDTEGNRTFEKTHDAGGALRKQLSQTFDLYNRLDTTAQANETADYTFAPDGTLDVESDGAGTVTDYSYDALQRLTQSIQDQGGSAPDTANATTSYGYDTADRLSTVADPLNGTTTYAYDDLGNLVSQTSPDTGTTIFTYDTVGNLKTRSDARGQLFTYSYDALDRLIGIDAPGDAHDITYNYDACLNGVGQLCSVTYGSGSLPAGNRVHYRYTGFGEVQATQGLVYTYDAIGRVATLTYPSGSRLTYRYDAAGQVSRVEFTVNGVSQTLADNLSHAPFGPLTGLSYGNGLTLSQSYDTAYRMTAQTIPGVLERTYPAYDANGNRLSQTDTLAGASSFGYDALNRLDTATGPFGSRDYDYDKNGNRTRLTADSVTTGLSYEPDSNRLDALGASDVLLDETGNTLNQGVWSYTYTPHNRLSTVTETATLKASFAYNALGQRVNKVDESATTGTTGRHFLYGENGELLVETDQDGNILLEYLYLNGQLLAVYSPDHDQDGVPNTQEADAGTLPASPDRDGDGLTDLDEWFRYGTDSTNPDSDGDGVSDSVEIASGTDPNDPSSASGNGDVNGNGETNLGDMVLLYQMVTGARTPTPEEQTRGDMNQDGQLNAADLLLLQRLLLQSWWDNRFLARTTDWFHNLIPAAQAVPAHHGVLYYVHNDPLGTPQAMTDETGNLVWRATYDPFGKATVDEDPDNNGMDVTLNIRFPGQYYDQETGLHYNKYRHYEPRTGRYITSDSIGIVGSLNTYLYANANPLHYTDATGQCPWCAGAVIGGAIGGFGNALNTYFIGGSTSEIVYAFGIGAAAGATFGATGGAGGSVTSFLASGAASGAITAGGTALVSGGNASQIRDAALSGAAVGTLTGVFGHSTALANALAHVRGGLSTSASIARGDFTGSLAAALSGLGLGKFERLLKRENFCEK